MFSARAAATLFGAQDAQSGKQGARKRLARVQGPRRPCYRAASPALARLLRDDLGATYGRDLPSVVACLENDFEACIAHLKFPLGHRRAIRTASARRRWHGRPMILQ